jgi:hypothetical protein
VRGTDPATGTCQANGVAAGTACRSASPACDTGLACSQPDPDRPTLGLCRTTVAAGAACDPRGETSQCTDPQVCTVTGVSMGRPVGTCTTPVAEVEPNTRTMPQGPVTASTVYAAALVPGADEDCFSITVPSMGSLVLEVNNGLGFCPAYTDTVLRLYRLGESLPFFSNDDDARGLLGYCSRIDGSAAGHPAHALAAGTYLACVASYGAGPLPVSRYYLDVAILAP